MIPVIIEQYIERLLNKSTHFNESQNIRYVLSQVRAACEKAIAIYDSRRS